jgi:hypothetical protein
MTSKRGLLLTAAAALAVSFVSGANHVAAAPILPGHLVVTQVGDGSATLTSNATPVNVIEMTTTGSTVQTIAMPIAATGANLPYAASGTQSEQHITLSGDGTVLTLGGYNATPGTASPANSTTSRILGVIPLSTGTPDTSIAITDFGTGTNNNLRSVVSPDGVQFYGTTANAGTRYVDSPSATTSTQINSVNARNANVFNGQLYVSSGSGTNTTRGVNVVGSGLPTAAGQTMTRLPGMTDAATASSWDFFFADDHTVYVVDDSSSGTVGGLQKWKLSDDTGQWSQVYRVFGDGTASFGLRSIAGYVDGGNAVLFVTNNQTTTRVLTMTDPIANTALAAGQVFTGIYTAPTNTQVRGVEYIPIPEPGTMTLMLGAGAMLIVRRRRSIAN